MSEDLDSLVRRVDEDRWLATRFAPASVRERLIALYAVNYEIAHVSETVREAPLGDIRLEWWRSALSEIGNGGGAKAHPALHAFERTGDAGDAAALIGIVDARAADFEAAPFETWHALERYVTMTSNTLMRVAIGACVAERPTIEQIQFADCASVAWAYVGLMRAAPFWSARGRTFLPPGATEAEMLSRAKDAYAEAKDLARFMPAATFPAFGYVALVPGYLKALVRGQRERPLFWRQAKLVAASATGRI